MRIVIIRAKTEDKRTPITEVLIFDLIDMSSLDSFKVVKFVKQNINHLFVVLL